jgi:hypothetical protein
VGKHKKKRASKQLAKQTFINADDDRVGTLTNNNFIGKSPSLTGSQNIGAQTSAMVDEKNEPKHFPLINVGARGRKSAQKRSSRNPSLKASSIEPDQPKNYYDVNLDSTLRDIQRDIFADSPYNFRSPSNPTTLLFSTGYHESVVTTDMFTYLQKTTELKGDRAQLSNSTKSKIIGAYTGKIVSKTIVESLKALGDGFRTDTAQTILSGPNGTAAGHSGSNLSTTGQASAHDLLRKKVLDILEHTESETKGYSEKALATLMGAITVASIAPATVARSIEDSGKLKDFSAPERWEKDRNEMKARVNASFVELTDDEKLFVLQHTQSFMESIKDTNREMDKEKPFSPERDVNYKDSGKTIMGGGYTDKLVGRPKLEPPSSVREYGYYFTQVKRLARPQKKDWPGSRTLAKKVKTKD